MSPTDLAFLEGVIFGVLCCAWTVGIIPLIWLYRKYIEPKGYGWLVLIPLWYIVIPIWADWLL